MKLKFTKMHGIGNDYIFFDGINQNVPIDKEFIIKISNRNKGVGSDGIIVILSSYIADFKMRMFNADGSEGNMCGNGIRCFAKFCFDNELTNKTDFLIETKSGIKHVFLISENNEIVGAKVNMGTPILSTEKIPVIFNKDKMIDEEININNNKYNVTAVSMGNPHAVVCVDDLNFDISKIGPHFEKSSLFPESVNTEFVRVHDYKTVEMRVWERGSGETLACGTGACAVFTASNILGKVGNECTVKLRGGDLLIEKVNDEIWMNGPAENCFTGIYEY